MLALVYLIFNVYIGRHVSLLLHHYGWTPPAAVFWPAFLAVAFSYLLARLHLLPSPVRTFLKVLGSYYIALFEFAVILLPFADLAAWLLRLSGIPAAVSVPVLGTAALIVLALLFLRGSWNAWTPVTRTYEIAIPKQAGTLERLKIAAVSDIHLGEVVGNRHLHRLAERIGELKPDLILLVGDVIDEKIEPFIRHHMAEALRRLQAPFGVYAVLGNHEYYGGHIEEYVERMKEIGIRVLRDESVSVNGAFYVVGRKDRAAESFDPNGRMNVAELFADLDRSLPILLMDHQPYDFGKAAAAGADLLVCGHTHRGQFAPNHWVTRRLFELDWGHMKKDNLHIVVSSGYGTWGPPVRLASRSEIVEIVIRFSKSRAQPSTQSELAIRD